MTSFFKHYDRIEVNTEFSLGNSGRLVIYPLAVIGGAGEYLRTNYGENVFQLAKMLFDEGIREIVFEDSVNLTVFPKGNLDDFQMDQLAKRVGEIVDEVYVDVIKEK